MNTVQVEFDGVTYEVKRLLSREGSNFKLAKGQRAMSVGLSLAPAMQSGHQTCPFSTAGCRRDCVSSAGNGSYPMVELWRNIKTRMWFKHRKAFKEMLLWDIDLAVKRAAKKGLDLACRLNTFSDIAWDQLFPEVFSTFPNVQFYDYTKSKKRMQRYLDNMLVGGNDFPDNWYLTFSRSENNEAFCRAVLCQGGTVAIPFRGGLPEQWKGFPVINGDETDERFLDPSSVVIGLKVKGKGRSDRESGFVVNTVETYKGELIAV